MSFVVGGSIVPSSFSGHIMFHWQNTRPNGAGSLVHYGEQWMEWNASGCTWSNYDWWYTQFLRGTAMAFSLPPWDSSTADGTLTFTSGYLWRPQYRQAEGGVMLDVHLEIHNLLPILGY